MKNKILLFIVLILSIKAISSSKKETAYFNNEEKKDPIKVAIKVSKTGEIKTIDLEEYITGVVAGEMPASFNEEALKAQAIASRTYAIYKMKENKNSYDLTTDVSNQVYITKEDMQALWKDKYEYYYNKIKKATKDTEYLIMTYNNEVILSTYFAKSNGKTEDSALVFGNTLDYLKSVESPEENTNYEITMSQEEFCQKLNISGKITINNIKRSNSGRVNTITINNKEFQGTTIRKLLGLKSTDFEIEISNEIKIKTKGYGHGVGMSQYGANVLANNGQNYSEILNHYYQNINIEKLNV